MQRRNVRFSGALLMVGLMLVSGLAALGGTWGEETPVDEDVTAGDQPVQKKKAPARLGQLGKG